MTATTFFEQQRWQLMRSLQQQAAASGIDLSFADLLSITTAALRSDHR